MQPRVKNPSQNWHHMRHLPRLLSRWRKGGQESFPTRNIRTGFCGKIRKAILEDCKFVVRPALGVYVAVLWDWDGTFGEVRSLPVVSGVIDKVEQCLRVVLGIWSRH